MKKDAVTIKDISKVAGVSYNTVSKALRGTGSLSKKTVDKIKRITSDMGYIPNLSASLLRSKSTNLIAIVYDNLKNPYYADYIYKLHTSLASKGYEIMMFADIYAYGRLSDVVTTRAISYHIKCIISFIVPTDNSFKLMKDNNVPLILVGRRADNCNSIYTDDIEGGRIAARELFNNNGKSFAFFSEHSDLEISQNRCYGFINELEKLGVKKSNIHIISKTAGQTVERVFKSFYSKHPEIDSVFCFSDLNACHLIDAINKCNLNVPNNINVIGFDNIYSDSNYPIRVSSIAGDNALGVEHIMRFLEDINQKSKKYVNILLPVKYYQGNTVDKHK